MGSLFTKGTDISFAFQMHVSCWGQKNFSVDLNVVIVVNAVSTF